MKWFFYVSDDGRIVLRARVEAGEVIGDARAQVGEGETFYGITYEAMKEAGSGTITVNERGLGTMERL
jgi:hypothetical protein